MVAALNAVVAKGFPTKKVKALTKSSAIDVVLGHVSSCSI
jgi:hypothetical protein